MLGRDRYETKFNLAFSRKLSCLLFKSVHFGFIETLRQVLVHFEFSTSCQHSVFTSRVSSSFSSHDIVCLQEQASIFTSTVALFCGPGLIPLLPKLLSANMWLICSASWASYAGVQWGVIGSCSSFVSDKCDTFQTLELQNAPNLWSPESPLPIGLFFPSILKHFWIAEGIWSEHFFFNIMQYAVSGVSALLDICHRSCPNMGVHLLC